MLRLSFDNDGQNSPAELVTRFFFLLYSYPMILRVEEISLVFEISYSFSGLE